MQGNRTPVFVLCVGVAAALLTSFYFRASAQATLPLQRVRDLDQKEQTQLAPSFVPGRILVKFRRGVRADWARNVISALGARAAEEISNLGIHVVELPAGASEEAFAQAFKARPNVEFAELDLIIPPAALTASQVTVTPNDPWYPNEWYLSKISAPTAWSTTTGSSAITIAILDTGVDGTHPDLAERLVPGWNIYDNNANSSDVTGHGTAVAGIVGAVSNNGVGVASVAWGCRVMPIRISDINGYATYSAAASGLTWAANHGARVANISYIMTGSSAVTSAASYLQSMGGVVTISAGNYGTFDASADNPYVLTVSGITGSDVIWTSSNTGNNVDLCAPYYVYTTVKGGGYTGVGGTSASAPIVAGVAALVLSANPALTAAQVQDILKQSADDLGTAGWDGSYGSGRVNAARALSLVTGNPLPDTAPPSVNLTSPTDGSTVSGTTSVQVTASDNVGIASVSLSVDGVSLGTDTTAPYSFSWNTTAATNGAQTLSVAATDVAGNIANASVSITVSNVIPDTAPPSISIVTPTANSTVSGTTSVQVAATDNVGVASVSLSVDGVTFGTDTTAPYSFSWNTATAANGSHTLAVTATDAAGNSTNALIAVTVSNVVPDTMPPVVSIAAPTAGSTVSGITSVQVNASDNVGVVSVSLSVDGVSLGSDATAPYSFAWNTAAVANGVHTLTATASDAAGNTAGASISVTVSNTTAADTAPPTVVITSPGNGMTVSGNVPVAVSAADNVGVVKVESYVDGVLTATATAAPFTTKWNTRQAARGAHTLKCKAYDAAGNVGVSATLTVYK